jgi:hypothetical protein
VHRNPFQRVSRASRAFQRSAATWTPPAHGRRPPPPPHRPPPAPGTDLCFSEKPHGRSLRNKHPPACRPRAGTTLVSAQVTARASPARDQQPAETPSGPMCTATRFNGFPVPAVRFNARRPRGRPLPTAGGCPPRPIVPRSRRERTFVSQKNHHIAAFETNIPRPGPLRARFPGLPGAEDPAPSPGPGAFLQGTGPGAFWEPFRRGN